MPPRSERREQTRQRIVDAAVAVVAKRGFEAASVNEIADAAGFSIGALYGNFAGKDELLLAVYDAHAAWFEAVVGRLDPSDVSGALGLLDDAEARAQFLVFVEFWAYAVRRDALRGSLAERLASLRALLSARLGSDSLAFLVLALWRGIALEWLASPEAVPVSDLAGMLAAVLPSRPDQGPPSG